MNKTILSLCGGVGGAKLAHGLSKVVGPDDLVIAVNTGDDFEHLGLHISPDLDTVMYTLAEVSDPDRGWGIAGETWSFMEAISRFEQAAWFNLGDKDLATHLYRTRALKQGLGLAAVTRALSRSFGIGHRIIPMTDDPLQTLIVTDRGTLPFQDYFVRLGCRPKVETIEFAGSDIACAQPDFAGLLTSNVLDAVILCPSNPFLSIDPILSLKNIRSALQSVAAPVVAVSPIIGGNALKGPAAKIMKELNMPASNLSIADYYRDFLDGLIIDRTDEHETEEIEKLGIRVKATNTVMRTIQDKIDLAETTLRFASELNSFIRQGVSPRLPGCGGHPG